MALFEVCFAMTFLGTVALLLRRDEGKPQSKPTNVSMPPSGTFKRLAAHHAARAINEWRDDGPNSMSEKLAHLAKQLMNVEE